MSRKRIFRGIKRIIAFVVSIVVIVGMCSYVVDWIKYPEFHESTTAYHATYGEDKERLEILDKKAQKMGYENFNDYRIKTW
jgi:hypothetical protein